MDTLDGTSWDVVIAGTGIHQSLLALALSRSGKKILHVDKNDYYGGAEAALSLQEAERWAETLAQHGSRSTFRNATVTRPAETERDVNGAKLGPSRSYNLSLAPDLLYTRSALLPVLVSSRTHQQLEFQALGSWFVYDGASSASAEGGTATDAGRLVRVPNGREDVFADTSLPLRAKGALMKFLRFVATYEEKSEIWQPHKETPFPTFLSDQFNMPPLSHGPLLALALSPSTSKETTTEYALPRIARHLRSIGMFGPGFGAVIPKWGGLSEVAQVACRAGAVGGATYVLGKGIAAITSDNPEESESKALQVVLEGDDKVTADYVVGLSNDLPQHQPARQIGTEQASDGRCAVASRSISIVSSPMTSLFSSTAEGGPTPAGAMVVFPSGSLGDTSSPPVHIVAHTSDTGECAAGHTVLYASTALPSEQGFPVLDSSVQQLLQSLDGAGDARILWSLRYEQHFGPASLENHDATNRVMKFSDSSLDLAFDDGILDSVKEAWLQILGDDATDFMVFPDRQAEGDEDEDDVL